MSLSQALLSLPSEKPIIQRQDWYALRTRARHERVVRDRLQKIGIEPLLPTMHRLSQWVDRRKLIETPLFPGYCFARFGLGERLRVLNTDGVVQIVGSGIAPTPLSAEDVDSLLCMIASGRPLAPHPYLQEGQRVRVVRGPLEGVTGIFLRRQVPCRLVLSVRLIQQAVSVEINAADIVPLMS